MSDSFSCALILTVTGTDNSLFGGETRAHERRVAGMGRGTLPVFYQRLSCGSSASRVNRPGNVVA